MHLDLMHWGCFAHELSSDNVRLACFLSIDLRPSEFGDLSRRIANLQAPLAGQRGVFSLSFAAPDIDSKACQYSNDQYRSNCNACFCTSAESTTATWGGSLSTRRGTRPF